MGHKFRMVVLAGAFLGVSATVVLAQPTLVRVKQTAEGYELGGKRVLLCRRGGALIG